MTGDGPSGSSEEDAAVTLPDQGELIEQPALQIESPSGGASYRGRGRGRGRGGFRGRANGAGRGNFAKHSFTAESTPAVSKLTPIGFGRGRGRGGRVKKSNIPRLQALYERRNALKYHYKAVATLQRDALVKISDFSLKELEEDPRYQEKLPEFKQVYSKLAETYRENTGGIKNRHRYQVDFIKRKLQNERIQRDNTIRVRGYSR